MTEAGIPKVSIAIPLYRAAPFVDGLAADIEAVDYPNLEILVSDQHLLDDALDRLKERFDGDPRVRFFSSMSQIGWYENYNFLLRRATGTYVRLLAQDDRLLPHSISAAVPVLESEPGVVLVFGPVDVIDGHARLVARDRVPRRDRPASRVGQSLGVFGGGRRGAMHGLIRTGIVQDDRLYLRPTFGHSGLSATAWLFALSLRGEFRFVSGYQNLRRVHGESFTARNWRRSASDEVRRLADYYRVGMREWSDHSPGLARRLAGAPALFVAGVVVLPLRRILQRFTPRTRRLIAAGERGARS